MTKKEMLNKVKMEIEGIGLTWLGRRTRNYTEKLNVIFISTDLEMLGNPVESLLDAYGLSSYFAMSEDSDVVLIRYTSVTMWASIDGGIRSLGSNTNTILNYQNFLADRYESGSLKKGDMINHVILHRTFVNYVLADNNFVKGVKSNSYSYWNMRKIMEYVNQQHVALFNDLSAE